MITSKTTLCWLCHCFPMGGAVLPNSAVPLALLKIAAVKDQIISTLTLMDADLSKHNQ